MNRAPHRSTISFCQGYGKRYIHDKIHRSNTIFFSKQPFTKRDPVKTTQTPDEDFSTYHHRYGKRFNIKINSAPLAENRRNIEIYLRQKEKTLPLNSLNFESEVFVPVKPTNFTATTAPFRKAWISPWKYSYKTIDYQTCTPEFRRVKSSNIDLSKY